MIRKILTLPIVLANLLGFTIILTVWNALQIKNSTIAGVPAFVLIVFILITNLCLDVILVYTNWNNHEIN
jgi:hypothetical protein